MSTINVSVSLRAWFPWKYQRAVDKDIFIEKLPPFDDLGCEYSPSTSPSKAAVLRFFNLEADAFFEDDETGLQWESAVREGFEKAAQWLKKNSPDPFDNFKREGMNVDIFIDGWIDEDQFELVIPPEFLLQCGEKGLDITIGTND